MSPVFRAGKGQDDRSIHGGLPDIDAKLSSRRGSSGHLGLYRLETQVTSGNGGLKTSGLGSNASAREAIKVGFDYFKANASRVSASIKAGDHDYHLHIVELHNTGRRQRRRWLPSRPLFGAIGQAASTADGCSGQH